MQPSPAVRVGIIVVLAILLFLVIYLFLTRFYLQMGGYTITAVFTDAQDMTKGSTVSMAGVDIGTVEDIKLDERQRAVVVIRISKQYRIPAGSRFILRVGLLVGEKQIGIVPNRRATSSIPPGAVVQGETPARVEDLLPLAQNLLSNLSEVSQNLNKMVSNKDTQAQIKKTLANLAEASDTLNRTMSLIHQTTAGQQGNIKEILQNFTAASRGVRTTTDELAKFVSTGRVQGDLTQILDNAKKTTASLERTTTSLEKLTTNPEFQENIRKTVSGARRTVENTNQTLSRINRLLGGGKKGRLLPTVHTSIEGIYRPSDSNFRADATLSFSRGTRSFLNLGSYDIGESNKLILEPGRHIGNRTDFRYGVYAGRLGLGLDHDFSSRASGNLNIYNPNSPTVDLLTEYRLCEDCGLLLGVDKLFKENQVTVGVRVTK